MIITDAQVHLWAADSPESTWPPGGRDYAHAAEFTVDQLLDEMAYACVARAVVVPPSFAGDRNDVCLEAAARHPARFAVMGRLSLLAPDAPRKLEKFLAEPGARGIRATFSDGMQAALQDPRLDWFWRESQRLSLPIMVAVAERIHEVEGLINAYPDVRLAIDHLGVPVGVHDSEVAPAIDTLCTLARFPNVSVKASAVPAMTARSYPFENMHHHLARVLDAFGPGRVFWGSDLTRLRCPYRDTVRLVTEALGGLSEADMESLLGSALSAWLSWPAPATLEPPVQRNSSGPHQPTGM